MYKHTQAHTHSLSLSLSLSLSDSLLGYDTTSIALSFAIYLLATHPEVQAELHAEVRRWTMCCAVCLFESAP